MTIPFPDHGAQEEIIRKIGKAELLFKRGRKILRFEKVTYGDVDRDRPCYGLLKPYARGRVLNVGLGMANSADLILSQSGVTALVTYELEQDIADVYAAEVTPDPRHTVIVADAHSNKPTGDFDVVLFELEVSRQDLYDKAKTYIRWAANHLASGGHVILKWSRVAECLANEFSAQATITILSQSTGRKPRPKWIVLERSQ